MDEPPDHPDPDRSNYYEPGFSSGEDEGGMSHSLNNGSLEQLVPVGPTVDMLDGFDSIPSSPIASESPNPKPGILSPGNPRRNLLANDDFFDSDSDSDTNIAFRHHKTEVADSPADLLAGPAVVLTPRLRNKSECRSGTSLGGGVTLMILGKSMI